MERGDGSFRRGMILTIFISGGMPSPLIPPQLEYWLLQSIYNPVFYIDVMLLYIYTIGKQSVH